MSSAQLQTTRIAGRATRSVKAAANRYPVAAARALLLVVPMIILLLWQLATLVISDRALPTPTVTAQAFTDGITQGWLIDNVWVTLQVVLQAFVISAALGFAVGAWLGMRKFWGDVLGEPLVWIYALPKITIFPVFLLLFGLGDSSRIAFGAFHGFFPLAIITLAGIRAVPSVYLKAARSLNIGWARTIIHVVLPAALPSVLSGLRFCFSLTFLGVVLAEMFGSKEGAGYELVRRITLGQLPEIFALALSLMILAFVLNLVMIAIESRFAHRGSPTGNGTDA